MSWRLSFCRKWPILIQSLLDCLLFGCCIYFEFLLKLIHFLLKDTAGRTSKPTLFFLHFLRFGWKFFFDDELSFASVCSCFLFFLVHEVKIIFAHENLSKVLNTLQMLSDQNLWSNENISNLSYQLYQP